MSRPIKRGSTDQSIVIRIIDSGDGTPELAVSSGTAGIDLWYRREGATQTNITEASLAALNSAHADGGIILIDDGYYRLDAPDAAFTASATVDGVMFGGAVTSMIVIGCYVPLVNYDPYGANFFATGAIMASAFTAAAVNSAALGVSLGDILADTNELQVDWANGGRLDLLIDAILLDTGTSLVTMLTAQDVALASLVAHATNIVADTNELQTDWTNGGRLDLLVDAILLDTSTSLVTLINQAPAGVWNATAATYAAAGSMGEEQQLHALSTEIAALNDLASADVSAAVLAAIIEGTVTLQDAQRFMLSVLVSESSGGGTSLVTFRDFGDTKARIVATVDANGNRTAFTTRDAT